MCLHHPHIPEFAVKGIIRAVTPAQITKGLNEVGGMSGGDA